LKGSADVKTVWIVDGAYMLKVVPGKLDYLKFKQVLEQLNGSSFFECYYLNSTPHPPTDAQDGFHKWLKTAPPRGPKMRVQLYDIKEMSVACPSCGCQFSRQVQKGVDVGVATLILKLATQNQYERLILSAGDGDFEDAISYVKSELHKEIWLSGFEHSLAADLQSYADRVIWLDDHWTSIKKD
jgi:nijmegen breakage syndrome protein 1